MGFIFLIVIGLLAIWLGSIISGIAFGLLFPALIWMATGYLAGRLMRGRGYGLVGNALLGLGGGIVGSIVFGLLGVGGGGLVGHVIVGVLGAVILVYGVRALVKSDFAR